MVVNLIINIEFIENHHQYFIFSDSNRMSFFCRWKASTEAMHPNSFQNQEYLNKPKLMEDSQATMFLIQSRRLLLRHKMKIVSILSKNSNNCRDSNYILDSDEKR